MTCILTKPDPTRNAAIGWRCIAITRFKVVTLVRQRIYDVLSSLPDGPISRAAIEATGITSQSAGDQAHGDAIGYVRQRDGLDFRSAVAALAPPARPWIDSKAVVTDEASKVRYQPLITFSTHGCRSRWSDAVLDAVREAFPDALADTTDEPALAFPDDAP